jgi:hypothetical protein
MAEQDDEIDYFDEINRLAAEQDALYDEIARIGAELRRRVDEANAELEKLGTSLRHELKLNLLYAPDEPDDIMDLFCILKRVRGIRFSRAKQRKFRNVPNNPGVYVITVPHHQATRRDEPCQGPDGHARSWVRLPPTERV